MEKIKKFFSNKLYLGLTIGGAVVVIAAILLAIFLPGNESQPTPPVETLADCKIEIKTEGGKALENIGIYVYKDAEKTDMVTYVKTDASGVAVLDAEVPEGGIAVLDKVPAGYVTEDTYPITQAETKIILKTQLLSEMAQVGLGDVMFDFTVTAEDGTEYTLSKLLREKKAVVLNFWYINCDPCKAEFPYLNQAYENFGEDVAVLALNPEGDKAEDISAYVQENGLQFPVFAADANWKKTISIPAYPTTVIIDRFGTIALSHTGSVESAKIFEDAFSYFIAEEYTQSVVTDIKSLEQEDGEPEEGSAEKPFEFGGVTEFEVTVPAGGEVYCDVYKVSGMQLKIEDDAAKLTYGEQEYVPEDGVIALTVKSDDPFTPVKLMIGNTATEEKTFKVTFAVLPGTMDDPLPLLFGDMIVDVEEGNDQGIYYLLETAEDGVLKIQKAGAPEGVEYNVTMDNLTTSQQLSLVDSEEDFLKMEIKAGEQVRICISTYPNGDNVYPAAQLKFTVTFGDDLEEETQPEESQSEETQPEPESTEPTQKPTNPTQESTEPKPTDPKPTEPKPTEPKPTEPKPTEPEPTEPKPTEPKPTEPKPTEPKPTEPEPTEPEPTEPEELNTDGTLVNEEAIPKFMETFTTDSIEGGTMVLYAVNGIGTATIQIADDSAYIICNDKTYVPENGVVSVTITRDDANSPTLLKIGNGRSTAKTYTVAFYYPVGSQSNPIEYKLGEKVATAVKRGNDQGVYYTYTASKAGTLTIKVESCSATTGCGVTVTTKTGTTIQETVSSTEGDSVSITLEANQKVEIIISALPDQRGNYPKATIETSGTLA